MSYNKISLGEIFDLEKGSVQTGPFGSQLHESDYKTEGIPVIMPKDIVNDELDISTIARISEEDGNRLSRHRLKVNDIVFPRRGDINKRILVELKNEGFLCGTGCIRLRGNGSLLNHRFLFYYLKQTSIVKWIENQAIGATMMNLNTSILRSVPILLPPLPIQKKIASILSAYDELIENNNQRIKLLEEMAEEIYKEWFVRLRFPGYENTPIKDGMPEGWEKIKIEDAFKVVGGGTPSTEINEYWDQGNINWFSPTDITASKGIFLLNSAKKITEEGLQKSSAKLFSKYSVMMTSRATIGAVGINLTPACTNQGFITCIPNTNFSYPYIYEWIRMQKGLLENFSSGSTFKEISRSVFKKIIILKPSQEIAEKYFRMVEPMFNNLMILQQKNQILQETRDLLLPRLISGKLNVEHLLEDDQQLAVAAELESKYL